MTQWEWLNPKDSEYRANLYWNALKKFIKPNDTVLDVNCGYSPLASHMVNNVKTFYGFDKREEVIEYLQEKYPEGKWSVSKFEDYNAPKVSVLLLVGISGLEGLEEFAKSLIDKSPRIVFTEVYFGEIEDKCKEYYVTILNHLKFRGYIRIKAKVINAKLKRNPERRYDIWLKTNKGMVSQYSIVKDIPYRYSKGMYKDRNIKIVNMFEKIDFKSMRIFEFACSYGWLAKRLLYKYGDRIDEYRCINFLESVVKYTENQLKFYENAFVESVDARYSHKLDLNGYNVFICTSLEHIKGDMRFIRSLPKGSIFIFSVPNFMSSGHFRCFQDISNVIGRYKNLLDFLYMDIVIMNEARKFVCMTRVK